MLGKGGQAPHGASVSATAVAADSGRMTGNTQLISEAALLLYCRPYVLNFALKCYWTTWAKLTRPCDAALRSAPFGQAAAWVSRFALRIACGNDLLGGLRNNPIQVLQPIPVLSFHCRRPVTALSMITERSVFGPPNSGTACPRRSSLESGEQGLRGATHSARALGSSGPGLPHAPGDSRPASGTGVPAALESERESG